MMTTSTRTTAEPNEQLLTGQKGAHVNQQQLPPQPAILQLAAASLAASDNDELEAELRNAHRLRDQIDQLKMSIPAVEPQQHSREAKLASVEQQQQQQQTQPPACGPERFAPLASLDFSITADTTTSSRPGENNKTINEINNNLGRVAKSNGHDASHSSSSTFETPTLSGYFDCDELSDMVDDSLFEITNAGCLSRSVFGGGGGRGVPATSSRPDDGDKTPTNDVLPTGSGGPPPESNARRQPFEFRPEAIRGHDYSSTSSVPQHARPHASSAAAANQPKVTTGEGRNKQLASARRQHQPSRGSVRHKRALASEVDDMTPDQVVGDSSAAKQQPRARSKSNSMLNRRTEGGDGGGGGGACDNVLNRRCPICCGQGREDNANKKQGKRRFTFSLFNLFSGGGSGSGGVNQAHISAATCRHDHHLTQAITNQVNGNQIRTGDSSAKLATKRRRHVKATGAGGGGQLRNSSRGSQTSSKNGSMPAVRLRDSIKITNQRKQRLSRPGADSSSERRCVDEPLRGTNEVLLDLSGPRRDPSRLTKQQPSQATTTLTAPTTTTTSTTTTITKNKSVKFTTPDRVMFLSPEPPVDDNNAKNNNHLPTGRRSGHLSGSQSSSQLADSMPAPIIKRANVPKSSSYSQTEPNKGLDELLAKYEQNNELVAEISVKLNLNERISSNKSLLDRSLSSSSSLPSQEDTKTIPMPSGQSQVDCPNLGGLQLAGQIETSNQLIEFETEDVDEELLEALHRRLDELDAEAEQVAGSDAVEHGAAPLEDFSNCDCNNNNNINAISGALLTNQTNANRISSTIQSQVAETTGDKT